MRPRCERLNKLSSNLPSETASQWIFLLACALSSGWPTKALLVLLRGSREMRKLATAILVLVSAGMGSNAAAAAPRPADQPRTMEEVVDRIIVNENHMHQEVRTFSQL